MHQPRKLQHRRLIVDTQFQLKYSLVLAAAGFFFCLIVGIALIVLLKHNYDFLVDEGVLQSPNVLEHVTNEESKLFLVYFVLSILVVGLFFYAGLFVTNRFVGPVKALAREMEKFRSGNLSAHLRLRAHDELHRVGEIFNESMQLLRDEIQNDIDSVEHWKSSLEGGSRKEEVVSEMNRWIERKKEALKHRTT